MTLPYPWRGTFRDGDLSFFGGGPESPKLIGLSLGNNEIIGSVREPLDIFDPFAFIIPQGQILESVFLLDATYSTTLSFFDKLDAEARNYIGGVTGSAQNLIGEDLLAISGISYLPSGGYSARFFAAFSPVREYHIDLVVRETHVQVPLPSTAWLFGASLIGLIFLARVKKRRL